MPAMLAAYLLSIPNKPPISKLITYWGLQTDDVFMLANGAFDAATGLAVDPDLRGQPLSADPRRPGLGDPT